ncbi:MAG: hypothetical protein ACTSPY_18405 [Candidatus Helarchaeota archaeon]
MLDYNSQKNILNKIANYLIDLEISFNWVDVLLQSNEKRIILLLSYFYDDLEFDTTISVESMENMEDWISLKCFTFDISPITNPKKLNQVLRIALELNFSIPETTFALYNEKYIYIKSDMPIDISSNDFKFELDGFSIGLQNLFDKLRTLGYKIDPTKGKLPIKRV